MTPEPTLTPKLSGVQLRAELERMVVADLLGPAGGETEEIDERNVRDRYLVGVLAPRRQGGLAVSTSSDGPAEIEDDEERPLIPDELSQGGVDTVDDGMTDKGVAVAQAHLPSSFGMTLCVCCEPEAIRVEATWGQYKRETSEDRQDAKTGKPKRV